MEAREDQGEKPPPSRGKLGMWMFLLTEMLLFGGLFLLYAAYRTKYTAGFHGAAAQMETGIGAVNTLILLTSSLTMALSIAAIQTARPKRSAVLQLLTILLGVAFLVNKYFEWKIKIVHGIYPDSQALLQMDRGHILFYGLYFIMTGIHGLHVLIGICVISVLFILTLRGSIHEEKFIALENTGLYWHFVDIVWIYLFPIFYLIA